MCSVACILQACCGAGGPQLLLSGLCTSFTLVLEYLHLWLLSCRFEMWVLGVVQAVHTSWSMSTPNHMLWTKSTAQYEFLNWCALVFWCFWVFLFVFCVSCFQCSISLNQFRTIVLFVYSTHNFLSCSCSWGWWRCSDLLFGWWSRFKFSNCFCMWTDGTVGIKDLCERLFTGMTSVVLSNLCALYFNFLEVET